MFRPGYRISEYFLSLVEQIAATSARIEAKNIRLPLLARLQKEALDRNAHSSTSIEGNVLSLAQVVALSEKRDVPADFKQKQEVLNYIEALRWIVSSKKTKINEKDVLKLHSIAVKGLLEDTKVGFYKEKQNYVVNEKGVVIYTPPSPRACPKLVRELLDWIGVSECHPIIRSAILHHQFVTIHPFSDGNGRLARILAQWILHQKQFDPHHIISLDDFYAGNHRRYYEKIQQTRDLEYDFTYWIEYVAEGILETAKRVYSRIGKLGLASSPTVSITPRQEEVINVLRMHGSLGSSELCTTLKINRARVNQLLAPIIKAGIVNKEGNARATKYYLGS